MNHPPAENHWMRLVLQGTRSNRSALGARVSLSRGATTEYREITSTAGYLSGQSPYLHFGLGIDRIADRILIHWPSGQVDELRDVPADAFYRIVEGTGEFTRVFPEKAPAPVMVPTAAKAE